MHADVGPETPTRERGRVVALVQDARNRVLLIRPDDATPVWQLPGGQVSEGETPTDIATRTLKEATGLIRTFTYLLAFDTGAEDFLIACDGGIVAVDEADSVILPAYARGERAACKWVHPEHLAEHVAPNEERKIRATLHANSGYSSGQLTLTDIRNKFGKGKKIPVALRPQVRALLRQHYEAGSSLNQIAADTGRSYGWAQRTVRESGASLRSRGGNTSPWRR